MPLLLPRKGIFAIAAVVDVALNASDGPVSARALAARHGLPPRHLEPVLQALVREKILRGIRGPRGGYEMARERPNVTVDEILRAAGTAENGEEEEAALNGSPLLGQVILPAINEAEKAFSQALERINLEDLTRTAKDLVRQGGGDGTFRHA